MKNKILTILTYTSGFFVGALISEYVFLNNDFASVASHTFFFGIGVATVIFLEKK